MPARRRAPRRNAVAVPTRGFTLIELMVVIALVGFFVGFGLDRLRYYQEAAEKSVLDGTLASLRSGLQLRLASLLIQGDAAAMAALPGSNPVAWLAGPPPGYLGEQSHPAARLPGRTWYFDSGRRELVYVPDLTAHLRVEQGTAGQPRLRFAVRLVASNPDLRQQTAGPAKGSAVPAVNLARLEPLVPYTWFGGGIDPQK